MKKQFILYSILTLSVCLFGCKDKDAFTISGTVDNPGSLKKIYLLQADSTQIAVIDSTNLNEQSKFQFKHPSPYPNMYKLRIGSSIFDMIAKNGDDIVFSTNHTDSTHTYQISGSQESEKIKEFNKITNPYVAKTSKLYDEYSSKSQAIGKESDSLIKIYRPLFTKITDDLSTEVLKFVDQNKTSLAGFYAASSLDPAKYEPQMIAYADAIKGDFKDNPWVRRFIKQMMAVKPISIGHKAPDFTITGVNDKPIKLSDYKGKYVMLDFWASWCAPCRQENPNVVRLYNIYKPKGLNILGISLDVDKGNWQKAIAADKLSWSHGSDLKNFEGPVERLYHIEAIPANFIIDPNGVIIAKSVMGGDLEEFLNKTFSKSQEIVKTK